MSCNCLVGICQGPALSHGQLCCVTSSHQISVSYMEVPSGIGRSAGSGRQCLGAIHQGLSPLWASEQAGAHSSRNDARGIDTQSHSAMSYTSRLSDLVTAL